MLDFDILTSEEKFQFGSWSEPEKLLIALKDYLYHSYGHWEANL